MSDQVCRFPLAVVAVSSRKAGFVVLRAPLAHDVVRSWSLRHLGAALKRRALIERRILHATLWFKPAILLVTHGSRWGVESASRSRIRYILRRIPVSVRFMGLEEACSILGCHRSLKAIAERLLDVHPELEPRIRHALNAQSSNARDIRPLLSALAVAHAVSVAHISKFG